MKYIGILFAAIFIVGCTPATEGVETARVDLNDIAIHVPVVWRKLDNRFNKGEPLAAFGDIVGSKNKQSIVAFRIANIFESTDKFDADYCTRYGRLSIVNDIYDQENAEIKPESTNFDEATKRCYFYYNWSAPNTSNVRGVDLVMQKGQDLLVVEGTSIDGTNFELVKELVLKTESLS